MIIKPMKQDLILYVNLLLMKGIPFGQEEVIVQYVVACAPVVLAVHACGPLQKRLVEIISWPSRSETAVHLSWLARPHMWHYRLIDIKWDVKEPLKTGSSLAVTTLRVPYI